MTKVKLDNSEVPELRRRIKKIARFKKRGKKADDYFALKSKIYPKKAFRIRAVDDKFEFNFKRWLRKYWTKEIVVKEEFEFRLRGKNEVKSILALFEDLGFVEWIKKIKRNETYVYKKDKKIHIEINHVKHLGYFMEIEYLSKLRNVKRARKKIMNVLKELKIDPIKIDNTGYTKMLWDKGTKDKKKFLKRSLK